MLLGMDLSFYPHSPALKEIKQTGKLNFNATTIVFQLVNSQDLSLQPWLKSLTFCSAPLIQAMVTTYGAMTGVSSWQFAVSPSLQEPILHRIASRILATPESSRATPLLKPLQLVQVEHVWEGSHDPLCSHRHTHTHTQAYTHIHSAHAHRSVHTPVCPNTSNHITDTCSHTCKHTNTYTHTHTLPFSLVGLFLAGLFSVTKSSYNYVFNYPDVQMCLRHSGKRADGKSSVIMPSLV